MSDDLPTKKQIAAVEQARNSFRQGMVWGMTNRFAAAVIPLLVLSVVMGFVLALCTTLFEWSWDIVR